MKSTEIKSALLRPLSHSFFLKKLRIVFDILCRKWHCDKHFHRWHLPVIGESLAMWRLRHASSSQAQQAHFRECESLLFLILFPVYQHSCPVFVLCMSYCFLLHVFFLKTFHILSLSTTIDFTKHWPCTTRDLWILDHRPLQKRERIGKKYGCFPFVWKTKIF